MAAGDITQGIRKDWLSTEPWNMKAGEYMYSVRPDGSINVWVVLPTGEGPANLSKWDPVVHEDGTLTLSPSIQSFGHKSVDEGDELITFLPWHGYLERGVWREV